MAASVGSLSRSPTPNAPPRFSLLRKPPQEVKHQQVLSEVGAHWVLYCLETATWQQLQLALSDRREDWQGYLNRYFQKLVVLSEISGRAPTVQAAFLAAAGIDPQPHLPDINSIKRLNGSLTPAWAALLETQTEGCLVFVALLHGNQGVFEAANKNAAREGGKGTKGRDVLVALLHSNEGL